MGKRNLVVPVFGLLTFEYTPHGGWPEPEDATDLNKRQLGNLKLTEQEEDAVVAFLKALTDGYQVHPRSTKQ